MKKVNLGADNIKETDNRSGIVGIAGTVDNLVEELDNNGK